MHQCVWLREAASLGHKENVTVSQVGACLGLLCGSWLGASPPLCTHVCGLAESFRWATHKGNATVFGVGGAVHVGVHVVHGMGAQ